MQQLLNVFSLIKFMMTFLFISLLLGKSQYAPNILKPTLSIQMNVPILQAANATGSYNEVVDSIILDDGRIIALATICSSFRSQACEGAVYEITQNLTIKQMSFIGTRSDEYFTNILALENGNYALLEYNLNDLTINIITINYLFRNIDTYKYSCINSGTIATYPDTSAKYRCNTTSFVQNNFFYIIAFIVEKMDTGQPYNFYNSYLLKLNYTTGDSMLVPSSYSQNQNPIYVSMANVNNSAFICGVSTGIEGTLYNFAYDLSNVPSFSQPTLAISGFTNPLCSSVSNSYNHLIMISTVLSPIQGVLITNDSSVIGLWPDSQAKCGLYIYSKNDSLAAVFSHDTCPLSSSLSIQTIKCKWDSQNNNNASCNSSSTTTNPFPLRNTNSIIGVIYQEKFKSLPLNESNKVMVYGSILNYFQNKTTVGYIMQNMADSATYDTPNLIIIGGSTRALITKVFSTYNNYSIIIGQDDSNGFMFIYDKFFIYVYESRIVNTYGVGNFHIVETFPDFLILAYDLFTPAQPPIINPDGTFSFNPLIGIQMDILNISLFRFSGSKIIQGSNTEFFHILDMISTRNNNVVIAYSTQHNKSALIIRMDSFLSNILYSPCLSPTSLESGAITEASNQNIIFASSFTTNNGNNQTLLIYYLAPDLQYTVQKVIPLDNSVRITGVEEIVNQNLLVSGYLVNENVGTSQGNSAWNKLAWVAQIDQTWRFLYDSQPIINGNINYFQTMCKIDVDTYAVIGLSNYDSNAYVIQGYDTSYASAFIFNSSFWNFQSISKSSFGYYTSCYKYGYHSFLISSAVWLTQERSDYKTGFDQITFTWTCPLAGFEYNYSKSLCAETCGDSLNYQQYECDTADKGCINCMQAKNYVCYNGDLDRPDVCVDVSIFDLAVNYSYFPAFQIYSTKPSILLGNDLNIKLTTNDESNRLVCEYSYQVINRTYINTTIPEQCNLTCSDNIIINLKGLLIVDNYFNSPIHEIFNLSMTEFKYPFCKTFQFNTTNSSQILTNANFAIGLAAIIILLLAGFASGMNFTPLCNLYRNIQLLSLFGLINIYHYSRIVSDMNESFSLFYFSFIPNIFKSIETLNMQYSSEMKPFLEYPGITNLNFIHSIAQIFLLLIIISVLFILFKIFGRLFNAINHLYERLEWNLYINFFNLILCQISVLICLQVSLNIKSEFLIDGFSDFIAYIVGAFLIIFIFTQMAQLSKYEEAFLEKYDCHKTFLAAFENFKKERGSRYGRIISSIRIIGSVLLLIFARDNPLIQEICFWGVSLTYLCYLGYFTPHSEYRHEIHSFIYEILIQLGHIFSTLLSINMDLPDFMSFEKILIKLFFAILIIEALFWVSDSIIEVIIFWRRKLKVNNNGNISKDTLVNPKYNNFINDSPPDDSLKNDIDKNQSNLNNDDQNDYKEKILGYDDDYVRGKPNKRTILEKYMRSELNEGKKGKKQEKNSKEDKEAEGNEGNEENEENEVKEEKEGDEESDTSSPEILGKIKNQNFVNDDNIQSNINDTNSHQSQSISDSFQKLN